MKASKLQSILASLPNEAIVTFTENRLASKGLFEISLLGQNHLPFLGEEVWVFKLISIVCPTCGEPLHEENQPLPQVIPAEDRCEVCIDK